MLIDAQIDAKYAGYAPAFVKRVLEKRRQASERERELERERIREAKAKVFRQEVTKALNRLKTIEEKAASDERVMIAAAIEVGRITAANLGYSWADMSKDGKQRETVKARDVCIRAVADKFPSLSLKQIATIFGKRNHTTILNSLRKTSVNGKTR